MPAHTFCEAPHPAIHSPNQTDEPKARNGRLALTIKPGEVVFIFNPIGDVILVRQSPRPPQLDGPRLPSGFRWSDGEPAEPIAKANRLLDIIAPEHFYISHEAPLGECVITDRRSGDTMRVGHTQRHRFYFQGHSGFLVIRAKRLQLQLGLFGCLRNQKNNSTEAAQ